MSDIFSIWSWLYDILLLFSMETQQISSNLSLLCPDIPSWIIASFFCLCEGVFVGVRSVCLWRTSLDSRWEKQNSYLNSVPGGTTGTTVYSVCVCIEFKRDVVVSCCDLLRPMGQSHPVPAFSFSLFNEENLLRELTNSFVSLLLHVLFLV